MQNKQQQQRRIQAFDDLTTWEQGLLSEIGFQPMEDTQTIDEVLYEITRLEQIAAEGWVEDELRLWTLKIEFSNGWTKAAQAIERVSSINSNGLTQFVARHEGRPLNKKGVAKQRRSGPRKAIDQYYKRHDWGNDDIIEIGQRMLVWQYLRTRTNRASSTGLNLKMTAAVRLALQIRSWRQLLGIGQPRGPIDCGSTMRERNQIAYSILEEVTKVFANTEAQWLFGTRINQFPAELELAWWDWHELAALDAAITAVYRRY